MIFLCVNDEVRSGLHEKLKEELPTPLVMLWSSFAIKSRFFVCSRQKYRPRQLICLLFYLVTLPNISGNFSWKVDYNLELGSVVI